MRWTIPFVFLIVVSLSVSVYGVRYDFKDAVIEGRSQNVKENGDPGMPPAGSLECGDLDGDGLGDMLIVDPEELDGLGTVCIYPSPSLNFSSIIFGSPGSRIEEIAGTGDFNGDGLDDIMIRDSSGDIRVISGRYEFPDVIPLNSSEWILGLGNSASLLSDLNGDQILDLIRFNETRGHLELGYGPLSNETLVEDEIDMSGVDVLRIQATGDLDGDGLKDPTLLLNDTNSFEIRAISSHDLSEIWSVELEDDLVRWDSGYLDTDGAPDLLVISPSVGDNGIMEVFGNIREGSQQSVGDSDWSISGTAISPIGPEVIWEIMDLDLDGVDDIMVGDPGYDGGRGRVSIFYMGEGRDLSANLTVDEFDASVIGDSTGGGLGRSILQTYDHQGDHMPDIWLWESSGWRSLISPANNPPTSITSISFYDTETGGSMDRAELMESVGIRCTGVDGSPETRDVIRAVVQSGVQNTSIPLIESDPESGVFTGALKLANGTIRDRSIKTSQGSTIRVEFGNRSSRLFVWGILDIDDPPVIWDPPVDIVVEEGEEYSHSLTGWDPEGEEVNWEISFLPKWMEFSETTLRGTPDDTDVGGGYINIKLESQTGNDSAIVDYEVINVEPLLEAGYIPDSVREGGIYTADIDFNPVSVHTMELEAIGNSNGDWLTLLENGTLIGSPLNRDVGPWSVEVNATDRHNSSTILSWNFTVENTDPVIIPPERSQVEQGEMLFLDFNCSGEGDGKTSWDLKESPDGVTFDKERGVVGLITTQENVGSIHFLIEVRDGNGGSDTHNHTVDVLNRPPVITEDPPSVLQAGSGFDYFIRTNEEGYVSFSTNSSLPFISLSDNRSGRLSGNILNRDVGSYRIYITVEDISGGITRFVWSFDVVENSESADPRLLIEEAELGEGDLTFQVSCDPGSYGDDTLGEGFYFVEFAIVGSEGGVVNGVMDSRMGENIVERGGIRGNITLTAWTYSLSRNFSASVELAPPAKVDGSSGGSVIPWIAVIIMVIILILLAALMSVERSSYVIQSTVFTSGDLREDEVVAGIHQRPGITYRELFKNLPVSRIDLLKTLRNLEERRMIHGVFDGLRIRFYPLMGSFQDRPLKLTSAQARIARSLIDGGKKDAITLSDEAGVSVSRIEKECSLMELKGAVTISGKNDKKEYHLSRGQRKKIKDWMAS